MTRWKSFLAITLFTITLGCERPPQAEVRKIRVDDVELAYYMRGAGNPLIMIMGFRGTMAEWDPLLLNELAKHNKLILFDNRGAGLSTDTPENHTTIEQMAEDTSQLITALGYTKVNVLGWSMGSRIAMYLAYSHPEQVEKLILCSPNPGGTYQTKRLSDDYAELTKEKISKEHLLSLLYPQDSLGREAAQAYVMRLTEAIVRGTAPDDIEINMATVNRQVSALNQWDRNNEIYEKLSEIRTPTLVAGGMADALDSPRNVQMISNKIPYAWSAYFSNAGHAFLSQEAVAFTHLIDIFIKSSSKTSED